MARRDPSYYAERYVNEYNSPSSGQSMAYQFLQSLNSGPVIVTGPQGNTPTRSRGPSGPSAAERAAAAARAEAAAAMARAGNRYKAQAGFPVVAVPEYLLEDGFHGPLV